MSCWRGVSEEDNRGSPPEPEGFTELGLLAALLRIWCDGPLQIKDAYREVERALGIILTASQKKTLGFGLWAIFNSGLLVRHRRGRYEASAEGRKLVEQFPDINDLGREAGHHGGRWYNRTHPKKPKN